jgi:hypothetical protein
MNYKEWDTWFRKSKNRIPTGSEIWEESAAQAKTDALAHIREQVEKRKKWNATFFSIKPDRRKSFQKELGIRILEDDAILSIIERAGEDI